MRTALHPQTQMTFKFADEILPRAYGFPMKIRVPTKLGFKNPKYVIVDGSHQRLQGRLLGRPGVQFVQRELMRRCRQRVGVSEASPPISPYVDTLCESTWWVTARRPACARRLR